MSSELKGVWRSRYRYYSQSRGAHFYSEHIVKFYPHDRQVVVESLPDVNASYLLMRLSIDDGLATGSWQEHTEENGYYKGAVYYGAVQFVIAKDRKHMEGKWVGFGRHAVINDGPWELTHLCDDIDDLPEEFKARPKSGKEQ